MPDGRALIAEWYQTFAPGLEAQPIPDEAMVEGPLGPLEPYGLQYRVRMPNGACYPRHQSGPGATIAVTDGARVALRKDFREETGSEILKCCGGFAGKKAHVAAEMVAVYNQIPFGPVRVPHPRLINLRRFFATLIAREYDDGFELGEREIVFIDRPIGNPNIRICSIMGMILLSPEEFSAVHWPLVATRAEALELCREYKFGDENTDRLIRRLCAPERSL